MVYFRLLSTLGSNMSGLISSIAMATVFEAIACQLPVILTAHLPGQEGGNAEFFEQQGDLHRIRGGMEIQVQHADGGRSHIRISCTAVSAAIAVASRRPGPAIGRRL